MKTTLKLTVLFAVLAALVLVAGPAQAAGTPCWASPTSAPVGSNFMIGCSGFSPNTIVNVYAVEPDGRASGINISGFFPTSLKTEADGDVAFTFRTEFPAQFSVPPGDYTFVVQQLANGKPVIEGHQIVTVTASERPLVGASLQVVNQSGATVNLLGTGYAPGEAVNVWVTQPPGYLCSGLGIDQLTLGALAGNGSSLWSAPGTVKADSDGDIAFAVHFNSSACDGEYFVSTRALGSGRGAETSFVVTGNSVTETGARVWVSPDMVPAINSYHVVYGEGFPANTGVSCWYTRPDGRVLSFINANVKTDAGGDFAVGNRLDDFAPFTSTEPGVWNVTCATPTRSALGIGSFTVYGLISDP